MSEIERYADKAMFPAAPMRDKEPKAYLLWMTPDPLGACAAAVRMYKGLPTFSLSDITDEERRDAWEAVKKTELKAPLEFIKFHFFIEGVDRAFSHQAVRQRTAVYAQESLRFAVKENLRDAVSYPPSLNDPSRSQSLRNDLEDAYHAAIDQVQASYEFLVANGVPAEDARALLPQATLTRLNYCTDLRNLSAEAGKRLCTQAQFHWRAAFLSMREAVRNYGGAPGEHCYGEGGMCYLHDVHHWQFELIADSEYFSPVCYQIGKCGFKAEFDRGCTIRDRVDHFESRGVPVALWGRPSISQPPAWIKYQGESFDTIAPEEWLEDPRAAWVG